MSYDDPKRDKAHAISPALYTCFKERAQEALKGRKPILHFKDNKEMNASLFNILSYGNAQFMNKGDTWTTSGRTEDLRNYQSMDALLKKHGINPESFKYFHEITRC